jgi:hypothetical protein
MIREGKESGSKPMVVYEALPYSERVQADRIFDAQTRVAREAVRALRLGALPRGISDLFARQWGAASRGEIAALPVVDRLVASGKTPFAG